MGRQLRMSSIQRLLLPIFLTPLVAIFAISSLNLNKSIQLRLLTWTLPPVRLGVLMSIGCASGALIVSSAGYILTMPKITLTRRVRIPSKVINESSYNEYDEMKTSGDQYKREFIDTFTQPEYIPERDLRDPPPTVAVPYKFISRPGDKMHTQSPINEIQKQEKVTMSAFNDKENPSMKNSAKPDRESNDWGELVPEDW